MTPPFEIPNSPMYAAWWLFCATVTLGLLAFMWLSHLRNRKCANCSQYRDDTPAAATAVQCKKCKRWVKIEGVWG